MADPRRPSPLPDRARVAEAIRRGVRLDLDPACARAAARGMAVELTEDQSLRVADTALAALAKVHANADLDGRAWLVAANRDWAARYDSALLRHRALAAGMRRDLDAWRAATLTALAWMCAAACVWQFGWPRWSFAVVFPAGFAAGLALRWRLASRDRRREGLR